jgi:hypothetical protein
MTDLVARIDRAIAMMDDEPGRDRSVDITVFQRRTDRRLVRARELILQRRELGSTAGDAFERWAARVAATVAPASILACDQRLDQTLDDLVAVLADDVEDLVQSAAIKDPTCARR